MACFSSLFRVVPVGAAALIALGAVAAPTSASAEFKLPKCFPQCGAPSTPKQVFLPKFGNKFGYGLGNKVGYGGGYKHGGWGYGVAALGGMAVGLVAAGAASANANAYGVQTSGEIGECYLVRRRAVDEDGNVYVRRVRVCE